MSFVKCVRNRYAENNYVDPDIMVGNVYEVIEPNLSSIAGELMVVRVAGSRGPDHVKPKYFFEPCPSTTLGDRSEEAEKVIWISTTDYIKMLGALDRVLTIAGNSEFPNDAREAVASLAVRICSLQKETPRVCSPR